MRRDEPELGDIANQILEYLNEHPNAADTAEGIRDWWLRQHGAAQSTGEVQATLDALVARGVVGRTDRPGMPPVYRRARRTDGANPKS